MATSPESPQTAAGAAAPLYPPAAVKAVFARVRCPSEECSAFGGGVTMGGADALSRALRRHFKSRRRALQVGDLFYVSMGKLRKADE